VSGREKDLEKNTKGFLKKRIFTEGTAITESMKVRHTSKNQEGRKKRISPDWGGKVSWRYAKMVNGLWRKRCTRKGPANRYPARAEGKGTTVSTL